MNNEKLIFIALVALVPLSALGEERAAASLQAVRAEVDSLQQLVEIVQGHLSRAEGRLDSLQHLLESGTELRGGTARESGETEGEEGAEERRGPESFAISEEVGAEIDLEERNRYGLFKNVRGFVSAAYFKQPDGSYTIKLVHADEKGEQREKINPVSDAGIDFVRSKIKAKKG